MQVYVQTGGDVNRTILGILEVCTLTPSPTLLPGSVGVRRVALPGGELSHGFEEPGHQVGGLAVLVAMALVTRIIHILT